MNITIDKIISFPKGLAIIWNDKGESFVDYVLLRDKCPCANCHGESDVFGNIYKGANIGESDRSYKLKNVIKIGHYAIRITWADGHSDGIYTYDLLRKLNLEFK